MNFNDEGKIMHIEAKLKYINHGYDEYPLLTNISIALSKTTLISDAGKSFKLALNPKRQNIADLTIDLKNSTLSIEDFGRFLSYFQTMLDEKSP